MRPDRCGTGRRPEDLPPGDREVVEGFRRWLSGEVAMDVRTGDFLPLDQADGVPIATADQVAGVHRDARPGGGNG